MVSILDKIVRKNKNQPVSKAWLQQTFRERVELDNLMREGNRGKEISLLNQKYLTYPVHPVDWTFEELNDLWNFFEKQELTAQRLELLFKKQNPDFELKLKNVKNDKQSRVLLKKKENFIQKKLAMKARFLANKTQTFRNILRKFIRRKKFFVGFKKGRKKITPFNKLFFKYYKKVRNKNRIYKDHIIFNKRWDKPWWFYQDYKAAFRKLYPKKKFFNIARLHIRRTFSNIFFTLTDVNDKVIYSVSTGMVSQIKNLKVSRSQDVLEKMVKNIKNKLNFIKIRNLEIIFKSKCNWHYRILKTQLRKFGIRIISILDRRIAAHNGVRRKNKPIK